MNIVIKRVLTVAALVVVSVLILLATHTYGVWVISGIAVVLVAFGLLRKEKPPAAQENPAGEKVSPLSDPGDDRRQGV
jgi:hypothetical protein